MKRLTFLLVLCSLLPATGVLAAQQADVVGWWKLVSVTGTTADGRRNETPFGANPTGALYYSPKGRMMLMLSYGARPALSLADRVNAPVGERADAFATFFSYAGRYTIVDGRMVHHIEVASYQNWVGTDLTRVLRVEGRRLTLVTPPLPGIGGAQSNELVWERVE